jgi:predicted alpha/beta hydrolase family esterase
VKRVVANCSVVDWTFWIRLRRPRPANANYAEYIRQAFGNAYQLSDANWNKLRSGTFYNPWHHRKEIEGSKVVMFHAKDDPNVPYERTKLFAELTDAALKSINKGGHISTDYVVRKFWAQIKRFFDSASIPVR